MTDARACCCEGCDNHLSAQNRSGICSKCRKSTAQAELKREWRQADPRRNLLSGARQRAKARGLEFDLVLDDVVIPAYCPILGIPISYGDGTPHAGSPSLDRFNPDRGYTKDNVRVISHKANACKNSLGDDALVHFCTATLKERGFDVVQIIERIDCPRCYSEGPHERVACAVDGSLRTVLCARCHLEWRLSG